MGRSERVKIRGTRALITGGGGDIGLATARLLLAEGCRVVLVDRAIERAEALSREVGADRVLTIACDLADGAALEAALAPVFGAADAPDILVNNVGMSPKYLPSGERIRTWTMPLSAWNQVLATNLTAYFLCTKLALPRMIERRAGRIVSIASYAARTGGYQPACHYVASKAGVLGLTKSVAKEVGGHGITVNAINPRRIETQMTADVAAAVNAALIPSIPAGRLGLPEDIAKVVLFLVSDLADYLTGTAVEVNGGLYMGP